MRSVALIALGLAAALIGGCAVSPTPDERAAACRGADWWRRGYEDGVRGTPVSDRAAQFAACDRLGFPADAGAYAAGHRRGVEEYCTPENGHDAGYSGRPYRNVCPPGLEAEFLRAYARGAEGRQAADSVLFGLGIGVYGDGHDRRDRHHGRRDKGDRDDGGHGDADRDSPRWQWWDRDRRDGDDDGGDDSGDGNDGGAAGGGWVHEDWSDRVGSDRETDDRDSSGRDDDGGDDRGGWDADDHGIDRGGDSGGGIWPIRD